LREHHFTVIEDPQIAQPRQTDLIAVKLGERYLVECKWRTAAATIDDIDALRSRLERTSGDVTGVLVSMAGFTNEVKINAVQQRRQPVLLLSGMELHELEAGYRVSLPALLYRKQERLVRDAVVLLDDAHDPQVGRAGLPFPQPLLRFGTKDGSDRSSVIDFGGGFNALIFSHRLVDIDWAPAMGAGVSLDIRLDFGNEAEVIGVFHTLLDLGWVSEDGRWSIDQGSRTWHGIGLKSLVEELPRWEGRADHHTEQVSYVDRCEGGFYTLEVDLRADRDRQVAWMRLSFQLEGVPLDTAPLLHLCRSFGAYDDLHVRPRGEKSIQLLNLRSDSIELSLRQYVVADDLDRHGNRQDWAAGIVVDNPFHGRLNRLAQRKLPPELAILSGSECLVCDLRHHHPLSDSPGMYFWLFSIKRGDVGVTRALA